MEVEQKNETTKVSIKKLRDLWIYYCVNIV